MDSIINSYKDDGFYLKKNLFTKSFCEDYKKNLENIDTNINIPFSNIKWGYGNLIDREPFCNIKQNSFINNFCQTLFNNNTNYVHLYVHNKSKWIGNDIEWHQEIFNINSYHPIKNKLSIDEILDNYIQIFVKATIKKVIERDTKGMYKRFAEGNTHNLVGMDIPYYEPKSPDIIVHTDKDTVSESHNIIIKHLKKLNVLE